MPPLARAVEPEHTVSRSRTITRPAPSRARWYAVLTPMMPAPTITMSAVSVMSIRSVPSLYDPAAIFQLTLFRLRDFRCLGASILLNAVGLMGQTAVLGWLTLELTNSPSMVGA